MRPSAAFDHVAGSDRKAARQADGLGTHDTLLGNGTPPDRATMPSHRVSSATARRRSRILESLWISAARLLRRQAVLLGERLERGFRPRAEVLDHLRGRHGAEPARRSRSSAPRDSPTRKPAAKRSPAPVASTTRSTGAAGNRVGLLACHHQAALFAAGDDAHPRILAQRVHGGIEIGGLIEAVQLALVGENQVHRARCGSDRGTRRDSGRRRTHPTASAPRRARPRARSSRP